MMEAFVQPNQVLREDNWIFNLKKCLGIIYNCYIQLELIPEEMFAQLSTYNFILKISECFTLNPNIRENIKDVMYNGDGEFQFVNNQNYTLMKNYFTNCCDENKKEDLVLRLMWQLQKGDDFNNDF